MRPEVQEDLKQIQAAYQFGAQVLSIIHKIQSMSSDRQVRKAIEVLGKIDVEPSVLRYAAASASQIFHFQLKMVIRRRLLR